MRLAEARPARAWCTWPATDSSGGATRCSPGCGWPTVDHRGRDPASGSHRRAGRAERLRVRQHGRSAEPVGLGWAFLAAGASGVVVSQWMVHDDATHQLMGPFYRGFVAGAPPAARCARRSSRPPRASAPVLLGAVQLPGRSRPRTRTVRDCTEEHSLRRGPAMGPCWLRAVAVALHRRTARRGPGGRDLVVQVNQERGYAIADVTRRYGPGSADPGRGAAIYRVRTTWSGRATWSS